MYAVWKKAEPLIREAPRENPSFLSNFERLISFCALYLSELADSKDETEIA